MESLGSDLPESVVKILASRDSRTASGAAFFISPTHLLTCYHVIRPVGAREAWFQAPGGSVCLAKVVEEYSSPTHLDDYAVLEIQDPQDSFSGRVVLMDTEWEVNDEVAAFGFQYDEFALGFPATGTITGETLQRNRRLLVLDRTNHFREGISGSPLVSVRTGAVIGIASLSLVSSDRTALGTPAAVILRAHPTVAAINLSAAVASGTASYQRRLLGDFAELTLLRKTLPLDQVYVSLRLLKGYREGTSSLSADSLEHIEKLRGYLRGFKRSADWEIEEVRHLQTIQRRREERNELLITVEEALSFGRLVVLGSPGSGKTTLLKHLALALARGAFAQRFPIFVTLNDYARIEEATNAGLLDYLVTAVTRMQPERTKVLERLVKRMLEEGRCCVMLDALDEVVQASRRATVAAQIRQLANRLNGNIWIVTSRKVGFKPEWLSDFQAVEVKELEISDIERLVSNWLGPAKTHLTEALVSTVRVNNRLLAFATNPLLLSFLVLVYESGDGRLPQARAELYGAIIDLLLQWDMERDRATRTPGTPLSHESKTEVLAYLALAVHLREREILSRQEWVGLIRRGPIPSKDSGDVFDELWASGILARVSEDGWKFLHLSVQEHLAAVGLSRPSAWAIIDDGIGVTSEPDFAVRRFRDPWWREVIVQLASLIKERADELIRRLASPEETDVARMNLMFAAECLANNHEVSPRIRTTVIRELLEAYRSAECEGLRAAIRRCVTSTAIGVADRAFSDDLEQAFVFEHPDAMATTARRLSELGFAEDLGGFVNLVGREQRSSEFLTTDHERWLRAYSVKVLGQARSRADIVSALTGALSDPAFYVRLYATESLARLASDSPAACEALDLALRDASVVVAHAAARSIKRAGLAMDHRRAVRRIAAHIRSPHWYVRLEGVRALGGYADDLEANELLAAASTDPNPWVRAASLSSLGGAPEPRLSLGPHSHEKALRDTAVARAPKIAARLASRTPLAQLVRTALEQEDAAASDTVRSLATSEEASAVEYLRLFVLLHRTREAAIDGLRTVDSAEAVRALDTCVCPDVSKWLGYDSSDTKKRIVAALAEMRAPEAANLLHVLASGNPPAKTSVQEYLSVGVVEVLRQFVTDRGVAPDRRSDIVSAICHVQSPLILAILDAAANDDELRIHGDADIAEGLATVAECMPCESVLPVMGRLLRSGASGQARARLAKGLARMEGLEAAAVLRSLMADRNPDVRAEVALAPQLCTRDEGKEFLATLGQDARPEIRHGALASYLLWVAGATARATDTTIDSPWLFEGDTYRKAGSPERLANALDQVATMAAEVRERVSGSFVQALRELAEHHDDDVRARAIAMLCVFDTEAALKYLRRVPGRGSWRHRVLRFSRVLPRVGKQVSRQIKKALGQWDVVDDLDWVAYGSEGSEYSADVLRRKIGEALARLPEDLLAPLRASENDLLRAMALEPLAPSDGSNLLIWPEHGVDKLDDISQLFDRIAEEQDPESSRAPVTSDRDVIDARSLSNYTFAEPNVAEPGLPTEDSEISALALEALVGKGDPSAISRLLALVRAEGAQTTGAHPFDLPLYGLHLPRGCQIATRVLLGGRGDALLQALREAGNQELLTPLIEALEQECQRRLKPEDSFRLPRWMKADELGDALLIADVACEQLEELGMLGEGEAMRRRADQAASKIRLARDLRAHHRAESATQPIHGDNPQERRQGWLSRLRTLRAEWATLDPFERQQRLDPLLGEFALRLSFRQLQKRVPFRLTRRRWRFRLGSDELAFDALVNSTAFYEEGAPQWFDELERYFVERGGWSARKRIWRLAWRFNHPFDQDAREKAFEELLKLGGDQGRPVYLTSLGVPYRIAGVVRRTAEKSAKARWKAADLWHRIMRRARDAFFTTAIRPAAWTADILTALNSVAIVRRILSGVRYSEDSEWRGLGRVRSAGLAARVLYSARAAVASAIRTVAIAFLGGLGTDEAVRCLLEIARSADGRDVTRAGIALAALNHPSAAQCFEDVAYRYHRVTAFHKAFRRRPDPALIPRMITKGMIGHNLPRVMCFRLFRRMGEPGRDELVRLLLTPTFDDTCKSEDYLPRELVAEGLGEIGDPEAAAALRKIIASDNEPVRLKQACGRAITRLGLYA